MARENKMATAKACEDTSDHLSGVFDVINKRFGVELHARVSKRLFKEFNK